MKSTHLMFAAAGVLGSALLFTTNGHAGAQYSPEESCHAEPRTGAGTARGASSASGIGPGAQDRVTFDVGGIAPDTVIYTFFATVGTQNYTYTVPSGLVPNLAPQMAAAHAWFDITWNAKGQCTNLYIDNDSAFSQSW